MNGIIKHIREQLAGTYEEPELTDVAFWTVEEATGCSRTDVLLDRVPEIKDLDHIISRLKQHEPIQYVFGKTRWAGLDLEVNASTLIPRPETAEILALAEQMAKGTEVSVLDIGTGSGCIAIGLKKSHPTWNVTGTDISKDALMTALKNAESNGTEVTFKEADILSDAATKLGHFDMVVSNPPYICEKERKDMAENVLEYEPATALFVPDNDPLIFYRRIAELRLGNSVVFEINEAYGEQTADMLAAMRYTDIRIIKDTYGKDRFVTATTAE